MKHLTQPSPETLAAIRNVVGKKGVFEGDAAAPFLSEGRGRWPGEASLIVAPGSVEEVAEIVKICAANHIAITPQGGNTGLVGGQIPSGGEILVSLKRLRRVREIEPLNNTMTVDAGVTLAEAQAAAAEANRLFPLSIGSEGSCQIGGVISTNAGGVNVLRYGNMRDLVLGIEAVTPGGEIWSNLKRLRKDNTGYDLKQLFIGGEGTLGIVTGAVLKLFPAPAEKITAFAGMNSAEDAVKLLSLAQNASGGSVTSFEFMSRICVELSTTHIPNVRDPLAEPHAFYVLMEFSSGAEGVLRGVVETMLEDALAANVIEDAVIAESGAQTDMLWRMRHAMSEAITHESFGARHDVSVATSDVPAFLPKADAAVKRVAPDARIVAYGHLGDGNVHYDGAHRIGVEEPYDPAYRAALTDSGLEVIPLPVDDRGVTLEALDESGADAVLVTPAHQYPTGAVMAPERRAALLAWARARGGLVIEDDYDAEYRYDRDPVGALQGLDPERVVYAGTASKSIAPGIRLAWLAVPPHLRESWAATKYALDHGSSAIEQLLLADAITHGELDRHLRRMRPIYRARRDAMLEALAHHLPHWRPVGASAGLQLLVELPDDTDEAGLVEAAAAVGVTIYGLGRYCATPGHGGGVVLGYAAADERGIAEAIRRLAAMARAARDPRP